MYKQLLQLNSKKIKDPIKKSAKELKRQMFFKWRREEDQLPQITSD